MTQLLELEERHVTVYRLENDWGRGPYNPGEGWGRWWGRVLGGTSPLARWERLYDYIGWRAGNDFNDYYLWPDGRHPVPRNDGIGRFTEDHVCGFATMASLIDWFDDALDLAHFFGFHVSAYRVPASAVLAGGRQVMFDRTRAAALA